jgi:crotonobetainyl-CoA:carnitine CoA-transferase CaiB-like acyl-CoA transferase
VSGKLQGPLAGVRVLDLTSVLMGPYTTHIFADLGAEVIKIERPGAGDDTRHWGPPYLKDRDGHDSGEAAYYLAANRGKRSVTIDIASADGQALLRTLAGRCDVLVENYRVDQLARYGLDYATLAALNPRLVYCSITGFGQTGPHRERAGYDFIIQAMAGFMSITGERDDRPGGGPQKAGVAVADLMTGMYSTVAILAALSQREHSGRGQHIDMALYDTQLAMLANMNMNYLVGGRTPGRAGNAHANIVPYQVFDAADGQVVIAVGNDQQFARFCEVAGCAELARDPRFAANSGRVRHRDTLVPLLAERVAMQPAAFWSERLEEAGVPCGPIRSIAQAFADPQVQARELLRELPHPLARQVPMVACPIRMSDSPVGAERAPPLLGADTEVVLRQLAGLDGAELKRLRAARVI